MPELEQVNPHESPWHLLGATMRYWRTRVGESDTLRSVASRAYVDVGDLSKWERGLAHPRAEHVARIDEVLGAGGQLAALRSFIGEWERARDAVPATTGEEDDDQMERRAAMHMFAAIGAGAAIPPTVLEDLISGIEQAVAEREGIGVEEWEEVAWEHGLSYYTGAPGALLGRLTTDLAELSRLIRRYPSSPKRNDLLRVSAQLSVLFATELSDVGERDASVWFWRQARRMADTTGDRDLRVWVRGREAQNGYWSRRPADVIIRLADQAVDIAGGTPSKGLAQAHMTRASLLALKGDAGNARAALYDFNRVADALPDSVTAEGAAPLWGLPPWFRSYNMAYPYALLGDVHRASEEIDRARKLYPADFHGIAVSLQLFQSLALVADRDIDEGLDLALSAAHAWPLSEIRRRVITQLLAVLPENARDLPTARELRNLSTAAPDH